jgi:hypothetical protein
MADISASNWNEADASNSAAAPDGAPEGMAPSGVNDVLRAHQGAIKRWYDWTIPKGTAGTNTAYTLTYSVAPGALVDGMTHLVQFHAANGAAATLNVNGLGAIPLQYYSSGTWWAAPAGLFDASTKSTRWRTTWPLVPIASCGRARPRPARWWTSPAPPCPAVSCCALGRPWAALAMPGCSM